MNQAPPQPSLPPPADRSWRSTLIILLIPAGLALLALFIVVGVTRVQTGRNPLLEQRAGFEAPSWTQEEVDGSLQAGNIVVRALFEYRSERGFFPASLSMLSPEFLEVVPSPIRGDWDYAPIDGGRHFELRFGADDPAAARYLSQRGAWYFDEELRRRQPELVEERD